MSSFSSAVACAFSLFTALTGAAQTSVLESGERERVCPRISVSCPSYFKEGDVITFTANVVGGDAKVVPRYTWTIAAGRIIEGQGTSSIKIDTVGLGQSYTASVSVSGFDQNCSTTASCSLIPGVPPPPAVLFDRYYPKSIGAGVAKRTHRRRKATRQH